MLYDLAIDMGSHPGQLALLGEAVERAGIKVRGAGLFFLDGRGSAHFLFDDGHAAAAVIAAAGVQVDRVREVLVLPIPAHATAELGRLRAALDDAGVVVEVIYSDNEQRLVLVADDLDTARRVLIPWSTDPV